MLSEAFIELLFQRLEPILKEKTYAHSRYSRTLRAPKADDLEDVTMLWIKNDTDEIYIHANINESAFYVRTSSKKSRPWQNRVKIIVHYADPECLDQCFKIVIGMLGE